MTVDCHDSVHYCDALGIKVPSLEALGSHREANTFALLILALLERGGPMTLAEVAGRFEAAGIAPAHRALLALKRCRPARAPVYRDGEHYALDPYDAELDLWAFRLGLRPPKVPRLSVARPPPPPRPGAHEPLAAAELDAAWTDASLFGWSGRRLALAVLDANGAPMRPEAVVESVARRTRWHPLHAEEPQFARQGSPITVLADGRWAIAEGADRLLRATRDAVRNRVDAARRRASLRSDPAEIQASIRAAERRREAHAAELAALRRVIVHAFPLKHPQAVVLVDVATRAIEHFAGDEIAGVRSRLDAYDVIAALEVRPLLRALGIEPGARRLAELGPPRKTRKLNRRGRTLKITTELLIRSSCGIAHPLADTVELEEHLRAGRHGRLRRRLEADAKSLYWLYEYGRLHGAVRLRWGFLDERIPAPWVHRDEETLYHLKRRARERGAPLEIVAGRAPGWSNPWARAVRCFVEEGEYSWLYLADEHGFPLDEDEVQLARIPAGGA